MELEAVVEKAVASEVEKYLGPRSQAIVREYIMLDRDTAFKELCVSRAFFDKNIKNKPQVKLVERRYKESNKVFYEPSELKRAILSITEF